MTKSPTNPHEEKHPTPISFKPDGSIKLPLNIPQPPKQLIPIDSNDSGREREPDSDEQPLNTSFDKTFRLGDSCKDEILKEYEVYTTCEVKAIDLKWCIGMICAYFLAGISF